LLVVGLDWVETHHDVAVMAEGGRVLAARRVPEGLAGLRLVHELLAGQVQDPAEVVVGTETDRHNHRPVAGDSELAEAVKVLARTHQSLVWTRQRQVNQLRSLLREFYPGALAAVGGDLGGRDALAILAVAPTPTLGRQLSQARLAATLRRAGRQRGAEDRAATLQALLRAPQLQAPGVVAEASGAAVTALVGVIAALNVQLEQLTGQLQRHFDQHPDAEILCSLPGLGLVLGARVVGEFGDDPTRYHHPKAGKAYAGTAPVTRASGKRQLVVARLARNRRLADACYLWAFSALGASPGARAYYDRCRAAGQSHPRPCGPWPTGWSASSMAACATAAHTTSTRPGRPHPGSRLTA
jgi:hypothetical protein